MIYINRDLISVFLLVLFYLLFVGVTNSQEFSPEVSPDREENFTKEFREIAEELEIRLIREDPNPTNSDGEAGGGGKGGFESNSGEDVSKEDFEGNSDDDVGKGDHYGYDADMPDSPGSTAKNPASPAKALPRPKDVGLGHDDDVVAKSIREAAEKEKDPELSENLWNEYRKYKKGN